jgi:hypothetical protein
MVCCRVAMQTMRDYLGELAEAGHVDWGAALAYLAIYEQAVFSSRPISDADLHSFPDATNRLFK